MFATITRLATAGFLVLVLVGCPGGSVVSVTIVGGDRSLPQDTTIVLTADVQTVGNAVRTVTWDSSDTNVATIDSDGALHTHLWGPTTVTARSVADPTKVDSIVVTVDPPGTLVWTRQFGTNEGDDATSVAVDANGNVYASGYTTGALEGSNAGGDDAFVRSYDGEGNLRWTRQFGTTSDDNALGVGADVSGNVYVAGNTGGALEASNAGSYDAFVRSYDSDGNLRWTRQFGTSDFDYAGRIAVDANGDVYAAGVTFGALEGSNAGDGDVFVRSYDRDGNLRWTRQFGTSSTEDANGIATDANGNVYATGVTYGALEGSYAGAADAFVRSYDRDGNLRWTRQFGTSSTEIANGVATDAHGHVYSAGYTTGALEGSNAGAADAFVRSHDRDGNLRWTRQFGTSSNEYAYEVATDANGYVYTAGYTYGALEGSHAGAADVFVRSYDSDGNLRWTRQFGTSSSDYAYGIATDASGNAYTAGSTSGALAGTSAGLSDAFIRKYSR
jgi:hypothetical protein